MVVRRNFDIFRPTDHQLLFGFFLIVNYQMSLNNHVSSHIHQITLLLYLCEEHCSISKETTSVGISRLPNQILETICEIVIGTE
tara:strand:- start:137 stop:388 length:252 start_codon:yes stop_codon:yes gene_type:complete